MKHIILLPTYNESQNIERLVSSIFRESPNIYVKVIDDNSPDGTSELVKKLMLKFPNLSLLLRQKKEGLGRAYAHGFREVISEGSFTHVFMMDADMSHDPKYLNKMIEESRAYDLVIGSRYVSGGGTKGWEAWRKALSFMGNLYARAVTRMPVHDMTGGYNCIKVDLLKKIDLESVQSSGYAFIMELKYALYKKGAKIKEVSIVFVNRFGGESKISNNIIHEGILAPWKMLLKKKKENLSRSISCPMCGGRDIYFSTEKRGYCLYKCNTCKLMFVYPLPNLIEVYDDSYFSGAEGGYGYVDYDADKIPMIPVFEKYMDILSGFGTKKGNLLDVGAATGFFMKIAKKRGFQVFGVEYSDFAAKKGRDEGLNIETGPLENTKFQNNFFDVVTMLDVLEHVTDPKAVLAKANDLLKSGGLLVINTPDCESLWAKVLGRYWHLILPPEHIHYFSPQTLSSYLEKNGYRVKLNTKIGKKFTFQYIFIMLYKWQGLKIWKILSNVFSKGILSKLYIPINLRDNLYMVFQKTN